jgi:phosphatidate cytidylyltransferase
MIRTIYLIIVAYFFIGGIGFYFINRGKNSSESRKSWTKFITYFIIIHILFFSIVINPVAFRIISIIIILTGLFELFKLYRNSEYQNKKFFTISLSVFIALAAGFFFFSGMGKNLILYSFLVLSIFDSFSQITGQLWGHRKIMPGISHGKTVEGLIGGAMVAVFSSLLFNGLIEAPSLKTILAATAIVILAFAGDLSASFYKRVYKAKDFSNLIPGHGGFLDRFDSMIAVGAGLAFLGIFINL